MSTATKARPRTEPDTVMSFLVGRGGLLKFVEVVPEPPGRIYYRDGSVTIVSPSPPHEHELLLLGEVVETICDELDVDHSPVGSTLFRRDDLDRGVMPDRAYYIEHQGAIDRVKETVDLGRYPPPDLLLKVVWTHGAAGALEILGSIGVPEVWLYDVTKARLEFLHREAGGSYAPHPRSRSFPFVGPDEVLAQLQPGLRPWRTLQPLEASPPGLGAGDTRAEEGRGLIPVVLVWEQIGLTPLRLGRRPGRRERIAAGLRQLLRAHDAGDAVAACMASSILCRCLQVEVDHLLRDEPEWDSEARWLDSFSTSQIFRLPPDRVRVYDAMGWGLRSNVAGRLWPVPFEADVLLSPDLEVVLRYCIRFGDRRTIPGEGAREGFARVVRDIEAGAVVLAFVWEREWPSPAGG